MATCIPTRATTKQRSKDVVRFALDLLVFRRGDGDFYFPDEGNQSIRQSETGGSFGDSNLPTQDV